VKGRTHAIPGAVTGLAAGSLVLHEPAAPPALLCSLTAACALTPDLDSCGPAQSRSPGFVTGIFSRLVRAVSGGHRHSTHSLAGIAAFTAAAWLACHYRATIQVRVPLGLILIGYVLRRSDS